MTQISITILPEQEKSSELIEKLIKNELRKKNLSENYSQIKLEKKSIDARHGQLKFHFKYNIYFAGEENQSEQKNVLPNWKNVDGKKSVIIVGSGPAGLFGALKLLESGIKPIIIERGEETLERKKTIAQISTKGIVNAESNYCFGAGGAGTFSDGKLYTRSNKRGDISEILRIFNYFGANEKILTDAHPHIGTDKLPQIINNIKDFIISKGGEFYFNCKVVDFIFESGKVCGVKTVSVKSAESSLKEPLSLSVEETQNADNSPSKLSSQNKLSSLSGAGSPNEILSLSVADSQNKPDSLSSPQKCFFANAVMLATGHSATDIYEILARIAPKSLEAKTFAVGVRVEHPRELIDKIQYHGKTDGMGAAEYRLTTQVEGRGVYSFCMCPGGFVVPSSSASDEIVVNGMSAAERNSKWSNAAFVVETKPEDIPEEFVQQAKAKGSPALAGLLFRTWLEKETKQHGKGQAAPAQRMTDFLNHKESKDFPPTSYTPGIVSSRLDLWLPKQIAGRLDEAFHTFGKNMKGFVCKDAVMIAAETRTSTPCRVVRDKETCESVALKGLFPSGEGAGYSGGIVSSAMDGEKVCAAIAKILIS